MKKSAEQFRIEILQNENEFLYLEIEAINNQIKALFKMIRTQDEITKFLEEENKNIKNSYLKSQKELHEISEKLEPAENYIKVVVNDYVAKMIADKRLKDELQRRSNKPKT